RPDFHWRRRAVKMAADHCIQDIERFGIAFDAGLQQLVEISINAGANDFFVGLRDVGFVVIIEGARPQAVLTGNSERSDPFCQRIIDPPNFGMRAHRAPLGLPGARFASHLSHHLECNAGRARRATTPLETRIGLRRDREAITARENIYRTIDLCKSTEDRLICGNPGGTSVYLMTNTVILAAKRRRELIKHLGPIKQEIEVGNAYWRHVAVMRRLENFLEANPDRTLHLTDLCEAAAASDRTL